MIAQFKPLFIVLPLLCFPVYTSAQEPEESTDWVLLDSMRQIYQSEMSKQINTLQYKLQRNISGQQLLLDSLSKDIDIQQQQINTLIQEKELLIQRLREAEQLIEANREQIVSERERIRRVMLISGPSVLVLLLISTALCFLLIMRQNEQIDRKIGALRRYTHSEMEETRNDLLRRIRKRLKRIRTDTGNLKSGGKGKKGK
jgi:cytochrome c-type biogenesis protein CcmH/NrfG